MTEDARNRVRIALAERRWSQADLSRASGVDKNTISDFMTGKRQPIGSTLGKLEEALGLTPGTLAAPGEEAPAATGRPPEDVYLSTASEAEILAELMFRIRHLKQKYRDAVHALTSAEGGIEGYDPDAGTQDGRPLPGRTRPAAGGGNVVEFPQRDEGATDWAADARPNEGQGVRDRFDQLGEESQDPERGGL